MGSSPLNCWVSRQPKRNVRRGSRRKPAAQAGKMKLERLEPREVPAIFAPSEICGRVFVDCDNNGVFDANDEAIAGVTVSLSGTDTQGVAVAKITTTLADGT